MTTALDAIGPAIGSVALPVALRPLDTSTLGLVPSSWVHHRLRVLTTVRGR
ncbi:MAG: hypothetical protein ACRDR6_29745 [Pseudonocardiaceae bacterium]